MLLFYLGGGMHRAIFRDTTGTVSGITPSDDHVMLANEPETAAEKASSLAPVLSLQS